MFFDNCCASALHRVHQLLAPRNRYFSPGWTNKIPQFLWIASEILLQNVTPQVFNGVEVRGIELATPLPQSFLSGTKMLLAYSCVWGRLSCWNTRFQGHFLSSAYGNIISSSILMYSNWSMIPSNTIHGNFSFEKHPNTMCSLRHHF